MDLDIGQVRAFLAVAEELHFGRAAERVFLSQQALSKRVRRLEDSLTVPLFVRNTRAVELTEAGQRFLPYARVLVSAADEASAAARQELRPLNVDCWSHQQFPWFVTTEVAARMPELMIEPSARRSLPVALGALQRGEIDAAFGRVHDLCQAWPEGLTSRLVRLHPMVAVVRADHPLSGRATVRPVDLRADGVWWAIAGPPEAAGWGRRFGERFGVVMSYGTTSTAVQPHLEQMLEGPSRVTVVAQEPRLPTGSHLKVIPIVEPAPLFSWSLVWRTGDRHPALHRFIRRLADLSRTQGWLEYDPGRHWLPEPDVIALSPG